MKRQFDKRVRIVFAELETGHLVGSLVRRRCDILVDGECIHTELSSSSEMAERAMIALSRYIRDELNLD